VILRGTAADGPVIPSRTRLVLLFQILICLNFIHRKKESQQTMQNRKFIKNCCRVEFYVYST